MKKYSWLAALGVHLLFSFFLTASPAWSITISERDENGDGKIDQWIEDLGDERYRFTKDRDFDGNVDYVQVYNSDGYMEFEEQDFNFDGEMDDFYYYSFGVLERRSVDTNYDSQVDLWVFLADGVYVWKIERDMNYDGEVDYVKEYGPPPEAK